MGGDRRPFLPARLQRPWRAWEGARWRGGVWACSLLGVPGVGLGAGVGRAGGGPLLFSLTHFLGPLISSLCGSGDRDDP